MLFTEHTHPVALPNRDVQFRRYFMKNVSQDGKNPTKVSYFGKCQPTNAQQISRLALVASEQLLSAPLNWTQET